MEMILDMGTADMNRICSLGSWNNPDRSRLSEDTMMSNAFRLWGDASAARLGPKRKRYQYS
jgi:hypothetical protein